jgi:RNA polymerase sigma-70 factor (ECF subfamily)
MYASARSRVQSHDEAEEIVQNIFSTLWEKRKSLHINDPRNYLYIAVRNSVINLVRSKIKERKYWDYYSKFIPVKEEATTHVVEFGELELAMERAVSHLPEKSRKVFRLSREEGRSNAEIAELLHVSEKAIEYHLTQSLRKLRVHLKDFILVLLLGILA